MEKLPSFIRPGRCYSVCLSNCFSNCFPLILIRFRKEERYGTISYAAI